MEMLKAIFFGIVEGITEWLPVSSTGHLIILDEFIKLDASAAFKEMFDVVIQLGAILAVVVLYFNKLNPFTTKKLSKQNSIICCHIKKDSMDIWFKTLVALIPTILIAVPFEDKIHELFFNYKTVSATLIIYGILFIIVERFNHYRWGKTQDIGSITYKQAFLIGAFQVLSIIPGTSRSGATILGAILIGVSRTAGAEFTFFLAIPTMLGASILKIFKFGFSFSGNELIILAVASFVAFAVSVVVIKFLMNYIKKHDFTIFGYYRIILGIFVIIASRFA